MSLPRSPLFDESSTNATNESRVEEAASERKEGLDSETQSLLNNSVISEPSISTLLESSSDLELNRVNRFSFDESEAVRGGNYGRGCKWSPDGLCLLTCSQDHKLRLFELPQGQKGGQDEFEGAKGSSSPPWSPVLTMKESGTIYDFAWYPKMTSADPETCLLACTSQNQPIHLYDAYNGSLSGTYRCYDHVDEVAAARSGNCRQSFLLPFLPVKLSTVFCSVLYSILLLISIHSSNFRIHTVQAQM